jgi:hypothetical protein
VAKPTSVTSGMGLDLRDFSRFAKALRKAEPVLAKELRAQFRLAGELVAHDAQFLVGPYSSTISDSIKVRITGLLTVAVTAGDSPLAGLFELGNKGKGEGEQFEHPLFGNTSVVVPQPMHPFLVPAVEANIDRVELMAVEALDRAIAVIVLDDEV